MFLDIQLFGADARIRVFDIILLLLTLHYATAVATSGSFRRIAGQDVIYAYLLLATYFILNAALLTSVTEAFKELIQTISYIAFFWILTDLLGDKRRFQIFFTSFLFGIWALSLFNAGSFMARGNFQGFKQDAGSLKLTHGYSLVITVLWAIYSAKRRNFRTTLLLVIVAFALTLLSGERKAWLAAIAALMLATSISNSGRIAPGRLLGRALMIVALILPLLIVAKASDEKSYVSKQLTSTFSAFNKFMDPSYNAIDDAQDTVSNRARLYVTKQAQDVVATRPIFGLGLGQFFPYVKSKSLSLPKEMSGGVHNEYLRIAAETGFVGISLYFIWFFIIFRRSMICVRSLPYLDHQTRFRIRVGIAMLVFGFVMIAFRAGSSFTVLIIFMPTAYLYFPSLVIRLPNGNIRLASPTYVPSQ